MKLGGMGVTELLIILAVVLLIFGPKNLPKLGSALGKTVKSLRDGMGGSKKAAAAATDGDVQEAVVEDEPVKKATAEDQTVKSKTE